MLPDFSNVALSVVAPCLDEDAVLETFHARVTAACRAAVHDSYEIIMVDDGSNDDTWQVIEKLASNDDHLVGLRLMRNYGQQIASIAGISISQGQRVLLIDADLQDPPELISEMIEMMDSGADVVYGKRRSRAGETRFKTASAHVFYRLLRKFGSEALPLDVGDFRLMSRRVVDILMTMQERDPFIRGMVTWIGGSQLPIYYDRDARVSGQSKYLLARMMKLGAAAVTSLSTAPLRFAFWFGLTGIWVAVALLAYTLSSWFLGAAVPGWTSTITAICFFASVQLLVLGIMGEYIGRILKEVAIRPRYVVNSILIRGRSYELPLEFSSMPSADRQSALRALRPRS
jgi:glycosyltransferase involved in cell wall biosynthesis